MKKPMRIWGMSYGLIGDLVAGLPMLAYYEKKYPESYKYWVIERKCAFTAPVFFNHPLIDRIKITDGWSEFGEIDRAEMDKCDILVPYGPGQVHHSSPDWWNNYSMVEENAIMHGIHDMPEVLTEEEMKPKLYKWFDVGIQNPDAHTYTRTHASYTKCFEKSVALWPFAQGETGLGRSPSIEWYQELIKKLHDKGYKVYHYGRAKEPRISEMSNYKKLTNLNYFDQVKACLASDVTIGPNTGAMWVIAAYSHPTIQLNTNFFHNHNENVLCLAPIGDEAINLYVPRNPMGVDAIDIDEVIENVLKCSEKK